MTYKDKIVDLTSNISTDLVDFSIDRTRGNMPTQISSEFLTNKEQGDWAETTLLNGINNNSVKYVAVRYGKNDDINAGDEGFKEFFENYQNELDEIGKRPDILIFDKEDFPFETKDISDFEENVLETLVPKAKCGIEVRSSAFLINKYEDYMNAKTTSCIENVFSLKKQILQNYGDLLRSKNSALYQIIESINIENIHVISFRCPPWSSTRDLIELTNLLKLLKKNISEISKRTYLGITPKVEDLKVVYTWIKRYNVPHYYVQVFFDKAYGISFEKILTLIGNSELEGKEYFVEADVKNQGKTTIKINASKEANILEQINLPEHYSEMKELNRGRLLFYVKFRDSISVINKESFSNLFGFELE